MKSLYDIEMYSKQIQRLSQLQIDWSRLSGKAILLSGATGMIGSFLIDVLMERGDIRIIALGRDEDKARGRFIRHWGNGNFCFMQQDVVEPFSPNMPIDFAIHAASNTHPLQYAEDPVGTILTNIIGSKNMLDIAAHQKRSRFLFLSSVEVYGENRGDTERFTEDYCGYIGCNTLRAGYPESKRAGEALCQAYMASHGIDLVIPRLSRVYGPTMQKSDSKAIAQFILKSVDNKDIVLKSQGTQLYSYTYVSDAAAALLYILLYGARGEAYNIASNGDSDIALRDLAQLLADAAGTRVVFEPPEETERKGYSAATKALMDSGKLRSLGWRPAYGMADGIKETVEILRAL